MFGVVVCPKCHRARGADLSNLTTKCAHCSHIIDLSKARVYARTDSKDKLPEAVRRMTEKLAVNIDDYPAERKRAASKSAHQEKKPKKADSLNFEELRALATELSREKASFDVHDVRASLRLESDEDAHQLIEKMLDRGIIFEPQAGQFRIV
jgi:hypothetical protein